MTARADVVAANLEVVRRRIAAACAEAGRPEDDVSLVVVTKFFPASDVRHLRTLGVADVGENRHQEAQAKADALQADAERKHTEIMATINQQRSVLEGRIERLKTFEREYRVRLKSYLESQLEELEQRGSAVPVDGGQEAFNQSNSSSFGSSSFAKGTS